MSDRVSSRAQQLVVSIAARHAAARAVVQEQGHRLPTLCSLYRLLEFSANVLMLGFLSWSLDRWLWIGSFFLLWYLPAVDHEKSWQSPLYYPVLIFVIDDMSLLSLHPESRPAFRRHLVAVFRAALSVTLVFLMCPYSPIGDALVQKLADAEGVEPFRAFLSERHEVAFYIPIPGDALFVNKLWIVVLGFTVFFTILWIGVTLFLLCGQPSSLCCSLPPLAGLRDVEQIKRIDRIALSVQKASDMAPAECLAEMKRLQQKVPSLRLASLGETLIRLWIVVIHLASDIMNLVTLLRNQYFVSAGFILLSVLIFARYASHVSAGGLLDIPQVAYGSWKRGIVTDDLLMLTRADLGVQAIPILLITIYTVPFAAKNWVESVSGLCCIFSTTNLIVPFIFREFDLGIERDGIESDEASSLNGARGSIRFSRRALEPGIELATISEHSSKEVSS